MGTLIVNSNIVVDLLIAKSKKGAGGGGIGGRGP